GKEVDFVLERGGDLVGIEVKSGAAVRARDTESLRHCRHALGKRWKLGLVLYMGDEAVPIDDATLAIPMDTFFAGS
ncbi:MAG: ATP-binding protein, partial [Candidatus Binatia bacterium]